MLKKIVAGLLPILLVIVFLGSCSDDTQTNDPSKQFNSCESCHTNFEHLKLVYTPDTTEVAGGCSGDAPHFEPYERVYMGGNGFTQFKASAHGKLKCTDCHNGTDGTSDKKLAHSNNFVSKPSSIADLKCKNCHSDIVERVKNSIHANGWGQKRKVTMRSGLSGASEFDKLPESHKEGYSKNCATCHANCGECHVNRPPAAGGGLMNGHSFSKKPDMVEVCGKCHSSRGVHAYLGVAAGTVPDVHRTKAGFDCLSCHSKDEIHGDGKVYDQRYNVSMLPKCTDCHKNLETKNDYHSMHYKSFSCNTCHSQDYNNCGSCHIHGEGARIPSNLNYKIALNPLPEIKKGFKFSIVRMTLAAPDNWEKYGVKNYAKFDVLPTYNYTTPHNILRWTSRTMVESGKACSANCHIRKENGEFINKKLYLFDSDFQFDWQRAASKKISVDGQLPESWGVK